MNPRDQISPKDFGLFILSAQTGIGIIMIPAVLARQVGHDGWIAILLAGLLAIGAMVLIMLLLQRYRDRSIYEINQFLFGKWLGQFFNFLLLGYLIFLAIYGLSFFTLLVSLYQLFNTPRLYIILLLIIPTVFLTRNGFGAICRFSHFLLVIIVVFFFMVVNLISDMRFGFFKPVGAAGWPLLASAIPKSFFSFIGLEIAVFIYPFVKSRERVLRWAVIANVTSLLLFELSFLSVIGVYGETMTKQLVTPLFSLSRYLKIPGIERIDLFLFLMWFPLLEGLFRSFFSTAYCGARNMFRFKDTNLNLALFMLIVLIPVYFFKDFNQILMLADIVNYSGMSVILYLILCWGLSFIQRKGVMAK